MSFDSNWISVGFGGNPPNEVSSGQIPYTLELFNQHLTDFGDYGRTAVMDVVLYAELPDGSEEEVARYSNVDLSPGRDVLNVVNRAGYYSPPQDGEITLRAEYEYDAPEQGTFSGSTSRTVMYGDPLTTDALSVACALDTQQLTAGESVTITATVTNGSSSSGDVTVSASMAGASDSVTETIAENGEVEASFTFELQEPGEYEPQVDAVVA